MDTQSKEQLHDQLKQALVKIWFKSTEGKLFFQGTGFFIHATGYLLTAYHCVKGYEDNIVVESLAIGKQRAVVRRELSLVGADIAVLKVASEVSNFLPLGLIQSNDEIVALGYPQPSEKTIVSAAGVYEGKINRLFEEGEKPVLESNAMVDHGQSGSPVYHYASRRVVGLAQAVYTEMPGGQAVRFEPLFKQWPELQALNQQAIERWEERLKAGEVVKWPHSHFSSLLSLPARWWYYGIAGFILLVMLIFIVMGLNLSSDSKVKLVDYSVTYSEELGVLIPEIDLKMRNTGEQVAFIKKLEIEVIDEATYEDCRKPLYSLVEASAKYDIDLIRSPQKTISHAIKPAEVDRIKISVGRSEGGPTLTVYKTILKLIYDEDNKVSKSEPIFLKMIGPTVWAGMTSLGVTKEQWNQCVARNKENFGKIGYDIYGDNPIIKKNTQINPVVR